jgi:predicted transcriptional regulator of viral defense system
MNTPQVPRTDVTIPGVLLAREQDKNQLAKECRRGALIRVRHGAYCDAHEIHVDGPESSSAPREKRNKELARARALHSQLRSDHVFSHATAALLLGCLVWTVPDTTHIYQRYRASGRSAKDITRHRGKLPPDDVTTVDGLPVTSLARTVVDCALALHPLEALVIADSALASGVKREDLLKMLDGRSGQRGIRRARLIIELADGGAQSAWETWVRYELLRAGLPRPTTQMPVQTNRGTFHTDLGYEQWALGIEFDGLIKYRTDGVRPGHDPAQEFMEEKNRDEAIRRAGVTLERASASDKRDVRGMLARFTEHMPPDAVKKARINPLLPPA